MCVNLNQMLHSNVFQPKTNVYSKMLYPLYIPDVIVEDIINTINKDFIIDFQMIVNSWDLDLSLKYQVHETLKLHEFK